MDAGTVTIGSVSLTKYELLSQFDPLSLVMSLSRITYSNKNEIGQKQGPLQTSDPTNDTPSGNCTLGCSSTFNMVPEGRLLTVKFQYDSHDQLAGANISFASPDPKASFITKVPPPTTTLTTFGVNPTPGISAVHIAPGALRNFTDAQLNILGASALKYAQPKISFALTEAIQAERFFRERETKKKKERCQAGGDSDCDGDTKN
jgi:hypothetical protein